MKHTEIEHRFLSLYNPSEALHLSRFFKTGKGEYGEGDKFLGIRVPTTRAIVKEYKNSIEVDDCQHLIKSEWHEIRLAGFLLLIELYKKSHQKDEIVRIYLDNIERSNNWDLVDLVAPKILGDYLVDNPSKRIILDELADRNDSLWHQRVAIVATHALIRKSFYDYTIRISKRFLSHPHDLIHKATGWMLREVGKRGGHDILIEFLNENSSRMPRTALRYAIERLPENLRRHYLKGR